MQTGVAPSDTTPPTATLTSPTTGSTVSGTISITASASDNVGVSKVEFYCDTAVLVGTSTTAPYSVSDNTSTMTNGSHTFYAKAYDAVGNSAVSATSSVTVSNMATATPGQLQWVRDMVTTVRIFPAGIVADHANNVVVGGVFTSDANLGLGTMYSAGDLDGLIAKYSSNGTCQWSRRFGALGTDRVYGVAADSQNNVIVVGCFKYSVDFGGITLTAYDPYQYGAADAFVAKYSPTGALLWVVRMGGADADLGKAVAVDSTDNVYVAVNFIGPADFGGFTLQSNGGANSIGLLKISGATGATIWAKHYGTSVYSDMPNAIVIDHAGDVLVTGKSLGTTDLGTGATPGGLFIGKYSALDGSCKWARAQGDGEGNGITADPNTGNVIVTGSSSGTMDYGGGAVNGGFFIAAYDPAGTYLWAYGNGGAGDVSMSVAVDGSGHLSITGQAQAAINFGGTWTYSGGASAWYIANFTITGNGAPAFRWVKRASSTSCGYGVAYDSVGNLAVTGAFAGVVDFGGSSLSNSSFYDGFVAEYNK
jgi:hypothetical protein